MKAFIPILLLLAMPLSAASLYVRGGGAVEQSSDVTISDRDCTSSNPPALFGCGNGIDGRSLGARGTFGSVRALDAAIGMNVGDHARIELAFTDRALDLRARANFTGVNGPQPVRADGSSRSLMLNAAWAFGERDGVQPFVFGGAGLARNELDDVVYGFASIAANAVTITRGGSSSGVAWNAGAGLSMRLTTSLAVDVALRYTDLGAIETSVGDATIIRPTRTLVLAIDGTKTDVKTAGVAISLRWTR